MPSTNHTHKIYLILKPHDNEDIEERGRNLIRFRDLFDLTAFHSSAAYISCWLRWFEPMHQYLFIEIYVPRHNRMKKRSTAAVYIAWVSMPLLLLPLCHLSICILIFPWFFLHFPSQLVNVYSSYYGELYTRKRFPSFFLPTSKI